MANAGPNTNGMHNCIFVNMQGSQFFITFVACPWLDGRHTVFGEVTEGKELLQKLEAVGTSSGRPTASISIVDCGQLNKDAEVKEIKE